MAKKVERSKTNDDFDFDDDLNFDDLNFDDDVSGMMDDDLANDSRSPVMKALSGTIDAGKDELLDVDNYKDIISNALPNEYGKITSDLSPLTSKLKDTYREQADQMKPGLKELARNVDKLIPQENERAKNMLKTIREKLGIEDDYYSQGNNRETDMKNSLEDIFNEQREVENQRYIREQAEENIEKGIEEKRFKTQVNISSSMQSDIARLRQYNDKINIAYQKKSLELQYKSLFVASDLLAETKRNNALVKPQLMAIAKNTALPEIQKQRLTENIKETFRDRFKRTVDSALFDKEGYFQRGVDNIIGGITDKLNSVNSGIEGAARMTDEVNNALEMGSGVGMGKEEALSQSIVAFGSGFLTEIIGDKIKDKVFTPDRMDEGAYKKLIQASKYTGNLPGLIHDLRSSDKLNQIELEDSENASIWSILKNKTSNLFKRGAAGVLENFDTGMSMGGTLSSGQGVHAIEVADGFDNRTKKTINDIIPGLLSMQLRELQMLRTGREDVELVRYDHKEGKFSTTSELAERFRTDMIKASSGDSLNRKVDSIMKEIIGDKTLSESATIALRRRIKSLATENGIFDVKYLKSEAFYKGMDDRVIDEIKMVISENFDESKKGFTLRDKEISDQFVELKETLRDPRLYIDDFARLGNLDILEKLGMVKKSGYDRGVIIGKSIEELVTGKGIREYQSADAPIIGPNTRDKDSTGKSKTKPKMLHEVELIRKALSDYPKQMTNKLDEVIAELRGTAVSDINAKEDIRPTNTSSVLDKFKKFNIFNWKYKKGEGDGREHTGPMAQDINETFGETAAPGGTRIDLTTLNGINMAAISELYEKYLTLEERNDIDNMKNTRDILLGIKKDTAVIAKRSGVNFGFGDISVDLHKLVVGLQHLLPNVDLDEVLENGKKKYRTGKEFMIDAVKDAGSYLKEKGIRYKDAFLDTMDWSANKLRQGGNIVTKGIGKGYRGARALWDKHGDTIKGKVKDGLISLKDSAFWMMNTAADKLKMVYSDILPKGFSFLKDRLGEAKSFILDTYNRPIDIYVKGNPTPVMYALKMKNAFYYNVSDDSVINNLGDIKGEVKDAEGNIVLTMDDIHNGLVNARGEPVKVGITSVGSFAKDALGYVTRRFIGAGKDVLGMAGKAGDWVRGKLGNLFPNMANWFATFDISQFSIFNDKTNLYLEQIRDLLNYRLPGTPTDFGLGDESSNSFVGPKRPKDLVIKSLEKGKESIKDKIKGKTGDLKDKLFGGGSSVGDAVGSTGGEGGQVPAGTSGGSGVTGAAMGAVLGSGVVGGAIGGAVDSAGGWISDKASSIFNRDPNTPRKSAKEWMKEKISNLRKPRRPMKEWFKDKLTNSTEANLFRKAKDKIFNRNKPTDEVKPEGASNDPNTNNQPQTQDQGQPTQPGIFRRGLGMLGGLIGGSQPREGESDSNRPSIGDRIKSTLGSFKKDSGKRVEDPKFNDQDGDGDRDGNFKERFEEMEQRKKEKSKAQLGFDSKMRYKGGNIIDRMMGMIGGLMGGGGIGGAADAVGGAADLAGAAGDLMPDGSRRGPVGGAPGSPAGKKPGLLRRIGTPIANVMDKLGGTKAGAAVASKLGALRNGLTVLGLVSGATPIGMLSAGGSALMTGVGAMMASPVVLGGLAIAAGAYGVYKLGQFMTRNSADDIDLIRLTQYGLSEDQDSDYHYMFELEQYLIDNVVGYNSNKEAQITGNKLDAEEVLDIFGIDPDDTERTKAFLQWFNGRFKPVFLTHLTAIAKIDPKIKLDDIDDMEDEQKLEYIKMVALPDGPYNITASPLEDPLQATKDDVQAAIDKVKEDLDVDEEKKKEVGVAAKPTAQAVGSQTKLVEDKEAEKSTISKIGGMVKKLALGGMFGGAIAMATQTGGNLKAMALSVTGSVAKIFGLKTDYLEMARMHAYGLTKLTNSHTAPIRALEETLLDEDMIRFNPDNTATFKGDVGYLLKSAVGALFGISGPSDAKAPDFIAWFNNRFLPVYLFFVATGKQHTSQTYPEHIENMLSDNQKYDIATQITGLDVWSKTNSPFKDLQLGTDNTINNTLLEELKKLKKDEELKAPSAKASGETKPSDPNLKNADVPPPAPMTRNNTPPIPTSSSGASDVNVGMSAEGEKPPTTTVSMSSGAGPAGANNQPPIPQAGGDLLSAEEGWGAISGGAEKLKGIHPDLLKNFLGLAAEYYKITGKKVFVESGFRTFEQQAKLAKENKFAAKPGNSLHEKGLALDIPSAVLNEAEKLGLMRKYGFTRPIGGEPWHIEAAVMQLDQQGARRSMDRAGELIRASPGRGGGGYGTIKGAAEKRRNYNIAKAAIEESVGKMVSTEELVSKGANANDVASVPNKPLIQPDTGKPNTAVSTNSPSTSSGGGSGMGGSTGGSVAGGSVVKAGYNNTPSTEDGGKLQSTGGSGGAAMTTGGQTMGSMTTGGSTGGSVQATGSKAGIVNIIKEAAKRVGIDENILVAMAAIESGFNPNAKSKYSSASGLFQFLTKTWAGITSQKGAKYGIGPNTSRFDPMASSVMAGEYIKQNFSYLKKVKSDLGPVEAYMAHFLGPGGASTFFKAPPSAIAAQVLPKAAAANKPIFYDNGRPRTITEVYNHLADKMKNRAKEHGVSVNISGGGPVSSTGNNTPTHSDGTALVPGTRGHAEYQATGRVSMSRDAVGGSVGGSSGGYSNTSMGGGADMGGGMGDVGAIPDVVGSGPAMPGSSSMPTPAGPPMFDPSTFSGMTNTLVESLNVQKEILSIIKSYVGSGVTPTSKRSDAAMLKDNYSGKIESPKPATSSAVSLKRLTI